MLSLYDDLHRAARRNCSVHRAADAPKTTESGRTSAAIDFLAVRNVEMFRARVGLLHRIPYVSHSADDLPTVEGYYISARQRQEGRLLSMLPDLGLGRLFSPSAKPAGGAGTRGNAAREARLLCFPSLYASCSIPLNTSRAVRPSLTHPECHVLE